jgi:hypothetical protein
MPVIVEVARSSIDASQKPSVLGANPHAEGRLEITPPTTALGARGADIKADRPGGRTGADGSGCARINALTATAFLVPRAPEIRTAGIARAAPAIQAAWRRAEAEAADTVLLFLA